MTDLQRLNVKDFMDRLMYLASQIVACRSFSPISLIGKGEVKVSIDDYDDFKEILSIYKIPDSAVEISRSEDSTIYHAYFRNLDILTVSLKNDKGFLGVDE